MRFLNNFFGLHLGEEAPEKVRNSVISNISFRGANVWILACAILVASIGLNVNSTAVIIGAMLISPLMGPIVGAGFALATYDSELLKRSIKNLMIATVVGFVVSAVYFYLSPFKEVQSELLARTSPNIYDVMIAFFGGIVGAISITRVDKGNPIPGVAIATALMPPLCTAGFGLATLNFKFIIGAIYLYSINCFFIAISTFIIIKYLKYQPVKTEDAQFDKKVRTIIYLLMAIMIIPSFYLAYNLLQEKRYSQHINNFVQSEFTDKGYTIIYQKLFYNESPKKLELAFLTKKFDSLELRQIQERLADYKINNTIIDIKQHADQLTSEILQEIKSQTNNITEKDVQINQLSTQLAAYKLGDENLTNEVKILFPDIQSIYLGRLNDYNRSDTSTTITTIVYTSNKTIDEEKFRKWINAKYEQDSVLIIRSK